MYMYVCVYGICILVYIHICIQVYIISELTYAQVSRTQAYMPTFRARMAWKRTRPMLVDRSQV